MGLSLENFAGQRRMPGPECSVALVLGSLEPDDRAVLAEALASSKSQVPHVAIERVLRAKGLTVGTGAVGHHRRGDCGCWRA